MEFAILGPLEVRRDGQVVTLGGGRQRAVLAALLLSANEPVSAERLAEALWGEDAPAGSTRSVKVYVSRLRRALDDDVVSTTPAGYRLTVGRGQLDADRFERLLADGRQASADGRAEDAGALLREALDLWRGPALADVAFEPFAQAEIARLEEQKLAAIEARVDADLARGRHAHVIAELQGLVAEHPLRERLYAQLMLALYRSGRQADALQTYHRARTALIEQLGLEPGAELRTLEHEILTQDPGLSGEGVRADDARETWARPLVRIPVPPTETIGRDATLA